MGRARRTDPGSLRAEAGVRGTKPHQHGREAVGTAPRPDCRSAFGSHPFSLCRSHSLLLGIPPVPFLGLNRVRTISAEQGKDVLGVCELQVPSTPLPGRFKF